ncbi:type II CRISPR RNA-guided endonuclease Cas9, partial [Petrocella sp. FN5]|nr:type II CRISPR RNA-guided endonuclease Cas9 [Petrocella sp. FN5]
TYHLAGIKYANFNFSKEGYVLDEESYCNVLVKEGILDEGNKLVDLKIRGVKFIFSLYKNDIVLYEKDGIEKIERYLSRTMPRKRNYIETKPVAAANFDKQNFVGLSKTKKIVKINTDVLGNKHYTTKENFSIIFKLDNLS